MDGVMGFHTILAFFLSAIQSAAIITQTMKKRWWWRLLCGVYLVRFLEADTSG